MATWIAHMVARSMAIIARYLSHSTFGAGMVLSPARKKATNSATENMRQEPLVKTSAPVDELTFAQKFDHHV